MESEGIRDPDSDSVRSTRSGRRRVAPPPKPKTAAEKKAEAAAKKQQQLKETKATMEGEASGSKLSAKARKAADRAMKAAEKATKDAEKAAKQNKSKKRGRTDAPSGSSPCKHVIFVGLPYHSSDTFIQHTNV